VLAHRLLRLIERQTLRGVRLPEGVSVLDPLQGEHAAEVRHIVTAFHHRFYADDSPRTVVLGINPGRLGAGSTGLCFTDTKRCASELGIPVHGMRTHEPSSDFFYRMIAALGGPERFYRHVLVQAVCPLGFVKEGPRGAPVNLNYYDDPALQRALTPFIVKWLRDLLGTGLRTDVCICIGTGKNLACLQALNSEHRFFDRIVALEHPRFIMQYRAKRMEEYIGKYKEVLGARVDD
jgi:hypothetical protein